MSSLTFLLSFVIYLHGMSHFTRLPIFILCNYCSAPIAVVLFMQFLWPSRPLSYPPSSQIHRCSERSDKYKNVKKRIKTWRWCKNVLKRLKKDVSKLWRSIRRLESCSLSNCNNTYLNCPPIKRKRNESQITLSLISSRPDSESPPLNSLQCGLRKK